MRNFKNYYLFTVFLFLNSCIFAERDGDFWEYLYLENSSEMIYIYVDSTRNNMIWRRKETSIIPLKKNKTKKIILDHEDFENNHKKIILIFKKSSVDTNGWDYIKKNNLIDKKYELTKEDIKAMNFKLVYDGS